MGVLRFVIMSSDINQIIQEALSQNCTTTIVLGSTSKGKSTPLTELCLRTIPEHISVEEINEVNIYPEFC